LDCSLIQFTPVHVLSGSSHQVNEKVFKA